MFLQLEHAGGCGNRVLTADFRSAPDFSRVWQAAQTKKLFEELGGPREAA